MKCLLKLIVFSLPFLFVSASLAQGETTLQLFVESDSLTLYVASGPLWLDDLEIRALNSQGVMQSVRLQDGFDVLQITGGYADAGTCFVYIMSGSTPPLQDACSQPNQVFRHEVAGADVFWYDSVTIWTVVPSPTPSPTETPVIPPTPTLALTSPPSATPTGALQAAYAQAATYDYRQGNAAWTPVSYAFDGVEMVLVPSGCFDMGNDPKALFWDGDRLVQGVPSGGKQCFDQPFWIDKYEVTNAQYKRCVDAGACGPPSIYIYYDDPAYADHPVIFVDWLRAKKYAEWRSGALPTEREWEYASRGPDNLVYPWGDTFDGTKLNFCDQNCSLDWYYTSIDGGYQITAPVGSYPAGVSWVGALDLSGSVWEWVGSSYMSYPYRADDGREDLNRTDVLRVLRGGGLGGDQYGTRAADRYYRGPYYRGAGFRVVLEVAVL